MPLQATSGAASYDAFGGGVPVAVNYIEQVFQTYVYTGNGTTQTITNNIDFSTKGGLVWIKSRSNGTYEHELFDTVRGATKRIRSNSEDAQQTVNSLTAFSTTGFDISTNGGTVLGTNGSGATYASWSFREQTKFFDIVTYTGDGIAGKTVAHNLGSVPGCIFIKRTDVNADWIVYHRSIGATKYLILNFANAQGTSTAIFNDTAPTSTVFSVGTVGAVNASGGTYVAYVFAHNAGGFGLTGLDNVISCGSFTSTAVGGVTEQTLGYEPQFIIWKQVNGSDSWRMLDNMRGMWVGTSYNASPTLFPNLPNAEANNEYFNVSGTGFSMPDGAVGNSASFVYIAIRRGPMKVPTSGTSVFGVTLTENASAPYASSAFPVDLGLVGYTSGGGYYIADRLRGAFELVPNTTATESAAASYEFDYQNGWLSGAFGANLFYTFRRTPSFFDEVCYTGTGSARTVAHNLAAVPEMMIIKQRTAVRSWTVYASALTASKFVVLNTDVASSTNSTIFNGTSPTASVFTVGTSTASNQSGGDYVAYLFATCAGVSKVGSYTGTGALQTVSCEFTSGARFVMIKRTDTTGDWYTYDSSRGLTSGNDPYFLMNSSAAQVTGTNYVDTDTTGFQVTAAAPAGLNASGGTYIFLAIA